MGIKKQTPTDKPASAIDLLVEVRTAVIDIRGMIRFFVYLTVFGIIAAIVSIAVISDKMSSAQDQAEVNALKQQLEILESQSQAIDNAIKSLE